MRYVVLGIQLLEICLNNELFYNAQSYPPFISITPKTQPLTIHLSIHLFHTSLTPFIFSDYCLTPNLYKIASN